MNKLILLLVLISLASAMNIDEFRDLWSAWKAQNKKAYSSDEDLTRFAILVKNYEKVQKLNSEHKSAQFALNKFSDLTREEFAVMLGSRSSDVPSKKFLRARAVTDIAVGDVSNSTLPKSIDWRKKGAITPVKDQGRCGSCWSFGATGILESFYFINNGKLLSFSEQQLMDCDTEHSSACKTGYTSHAITYVAQNGIQLETDYPYTAKNGTCQFDQTKAVKVGGRYSFITPMSTEKLKTALMNSPVSVLIQADEDAFQHYKSGVLTKECGAKLDHSVLVVGYQEIEGQEAFLVKNSWGPTWGQEGYIYLGTDESENNGKGVCGILSQPMIMTV